MRTKVTLLLGALVLLAGVAVTASVRAADDPNNGTWKLNVEKSTFDPGPAMKSQTVTISIEGGMETYSSEGMDASGNPRTTTFTVKQNDGDSPTTGNPYGDTISVKRVSSHRLVATIKKDGKETVTANVVVAKDGKSRTVTYSGKTADGKEVRDKLYYDKQM